MTSKLKALDSPEMKDKLFRTLVSGLLPDIRNRIHVEGKKADGSAIGTYSNAYLARREKKYKRTGGKKKVYSLTSDMENDLSYIANGQKYGIGFKDSKNYKKSQWLSEQDGPVYQVSKEERKKAHDITDEFLDDLFNAPS